MPSMAPMTPAEIIVSMQMYMSWGTEMGGAYLFEGWKVNGAGGFVSALIATIILVLATEALSFFI